MNGTEYTHKNLLSECDCVVTEHSRGPRWLTTTDDGISLGFKSLEYAEAFVRRQSRNTEYLERWTFRLYSNEVYGTEVIATMTTGVGGSAQISF